MAAKKSKKAPKAKPEAREPDGQTEPGQVPSEPALTKAEEKKLVRDVELAEKEVDQAKSLVGEAEAKLSLSIKAISDACGNGPFVIKGRRVYISSRGETYFFKGDKQDARTLG